MGILNITPDSFADGGVHFDVGRAVDAGVRMVEEGADILDVGGESTRPGAAQVGAAEEMRRVLPVIERLSARVAVPISIDTYKAQVAREAVAAGATIVNDISGLLYDAELGATVAETGAALVLMHTRGRSNEMYELANYTDVVADVTRELRSAVVRATSTGVGEGSIILDPGVGFAKRAAHSIEVLARLDALMELGRPILSGPSRKSFLQSAVGDREPSDREWATAAAVTSSVLLGAHIIRVHNVTAMVDVVRTADLIRDARMKPWQWRCTDPA